MKGIKMLVAGTAVVGLALGLAAAADAQNVVTSLQGTANLQRVSTAGAPPLVQPLKFKDEVRVADRITTGDQSLVRILMGGKAVVTVRERSSLTITETLNTSTIEISAGKIALAVAKERMGANERIDIKTPNAVAGVRGTVVITEVGQFTAQAGGTPPGSVNTRFTLLTGALEVNLLDASGRRGATFTMGPLQQLSLTGFTPPPGGPRTITRAQGQAAANDYKVGLKDAPQGSNAQISDKQVEQASNAAAATGAGGGGAPVPQIIQPPPPPRPVVTPENREQKQNTTIMMTTPTNTGSGGNIECRGSCPSEGLRARLRR